MKSFNQFIGESQTQERLPVLWKLEHTGEYHTGDISRWLKTCMGITSESDIVELSKGSFLYDKILKKHSRFKRHIQQARISIGSMRLDWIEKRKYAYLMDETGEPLCFWTSKENESLFYKDTDLVDQLFKDL